MASSTSLKALHQQSPVIGAKFYLPENNLLFVGHGPILKVYDHTNGELIITKRIFKKNKIHGICYDHDTIAFYGGRSLSLLNYDTIMNTDSDEDLTGDEKMINDWIITGEFSYSGLELFILTAHNVILSIDAYSGSLQWEKSVYGEKSILYSGSIRVASRHDVFINAGTVMGGVIIWDLYKEEIKYNLQGHQGSIFNVQVSEDLRHIVSCSDDRSIKLWDFQTGELLSTAWGHTARIWNLKFYNAGQNLISVSEDLTARIWNIDQEQRELVANLTLELHHGRHIWGLDVKDDQLIAATGGNDGRVRIIDVNPAKVEQETEAFEIEEIVSCDGGYQLTKNELIKGFWQLSCGLVVITSEGSVFVYDNNKKWKFVKQFEQMKGFSLTNGHSQQNIITFTNAKGTTQLLKFNDECEIIQEETIVTEVTKIINAISTVSEDGKLYLLFESPNKQEPLKLYEIISTSDKFTVSPFKELTKSPTFVTTCFTISADLIFIGFRLSSIGIYSLDTCEELKLIRKVSLSDTVTSITPYKQNTETESILTVTNRDGLYLYLKYDQSNNEHSFIHANDLRKGFVEGAIHQQDQLLLYGFKSSYFYLYNESRDYEIGYVNCGGIHRLWKLFPVSSEQFKFVFIRASGLFIRTLSTTKERHLSDGTHGREIRDLTIREGESDVTTRLMITGAEDTTLKLTSLDLQTGKTLTHWTMRKHTSGLQKVKFINDNLVVSCGAREELFVWEITDEAKYPLMALIGSLKPESDIPDLRIMDFDSLFVKSSDSGIVTGFVLGCVYSDSTIKTFYFDLQTKTFTVLTEGRYKTCCLWDFRFVLHNQQIYIVCGATDGFLTVWNITEQLAPFKILSEDELTLSLNVTQLDESRAISKLADPLNTIQIHQNGIKDMDLIKTSAGFQIVSGGDDNGLGLIEFTINSSASSEAEVESQLLSFAPDAASSTITSVCLAPSHKSQVIVCSVDQYVRVWDFSSGELVLVDEKYTTVADTGSLDVTKGLDGADLALVGGVGLACWELK
ncbi:hypothetical protein WICPIJ_000641 [Wickerhamomyces pijperi]|uniref:Anaphase-promoting complex subunit 4 WD40 domain-containing protein n=1 Tax=Wickerhamomyces pijperi TaxID=599730 RepID=A0A9P8QCD9_WICPI|nr:hypothetical protein WICPIJ_000641 [Wickerhamomyces pijperi]